MESSELFAASIKMISALALVLGAVVIVMYVLKKTVNRGGTTSRGADIIRVRAVRYLGGKNSIALVDVAGTMIVVGLSPQGMTTLAQIDDPGTLDSPTGERTTEKGGRGGGFARHLAEYASRFRVSGTFLEKNSENRG
jgi:flagellar biogenesis protein FliO